MGGYADEGMKNVLKNLYRLLDCPARIQVRMLTPIAAVRGIPDLRVWDPDIIHYLGGPTYLSGIILYVLRRMLDNPKVMLSLIHPNLGLGGGFLLRSVPVNVCLTESQQWHKWAQNNNLDAKCMSQSGVDVQRFSPVTGADKVVLRSELGLPANRYVVLHVGHIKEDRNLRLLCALQREGSLQVVIVGSTATRVEEPLLMDLRDSGCIVNIGFAPKIEQYYQAADCYVFPTTHTQAAIQIPLSILEAMATNLPVVSTSFGGLKDFFTSGEGLTFVDRSEMGNLTAIVLRAVKCESVRTRANVMGFAWEVVAQRLIRLYVDLLNQRNAS